MQKSLNCCTGKNRRGLPLGVLECTLRSCDIQPDAFAKIGVRNELQLGVHLRPILVVTLCKDTTNHRY